MGSANDYAYALGLKQPWAQPPERLAVIDADVGLAEADGRRRFFVNGFGLGFNGAVTVEARKIKWIRGCRFTCSASCKRCGGSSTARG